MHADEFVVEAYDPGRHALHRLAFEKKPALHVHCSADVAPVDAVVELSVHAMHAATADAPVPPK